jgi:hypothetical protein
MKGPMVPPLPRPSRDSAILSDAVHRQCEIGIHRRSPRQGAGAAGPADARPSSPRSRPAEWVRPVAGSGFDPPEKWVRSRARPRKWVRSAGKMDSIPRPPPEMGPFRSRNGSVPRNGFVPPPGSLGSPDAQSRRCHEGRSPATVDPIGSDAIRPATVPRYIRGNRGGLSTVPCRIGDIPLSPSYAEKGSARSSGQANRPSGVLTHLPDSQIHGRRGMAGLQVERDRQVGTQPERDRRQGPADLQRRRPGEQMPPLFSTDGPIRNGG